MFSCAQRAWLLAFFVASAGPAIAGEDTYPNSNVKLDLTLPLQLTTNAPQTPTGARSDSYGTPELRLSANWNPTEQLGFSFYSDTNTDAYSRVFSSNDAETVLGALMTVTSAADKRLIYTINYEHRYIYEGIFKTGQYTGDDLLASVAYDFGNPKRGLTLLQPSAAAEYLFADDPSKQRYLYTFKVDYEQVIKAPWSVIATPKLRIYEFTDSTNKGRQDIFPSIQAGIKYALSDSANITTTVEYDKVFSNMPADKYESFTFSVSLNLSLTLFKDPK
jgi:hypothetical protein